MANKRKRKTKRKYDPIRSDLFSADGRRVLNALRKVKTRRTYGETKKLIGIGASSFLDKYLLAGVHAASWDELFINQLWPRSKNWVQEAGWIVHTFLKLSDSITSFLELRSKFGVLLITGKYQDAEIVLDQIFSAFGHSFWLLERRLLLRQLAGGFEAQKRELSEILNAIEDSFVAYCASKISVRIEDHMTFHSFKKQIYADLVSVKEQGRTDLSDLVEFQIFPWGDSWERSSEDLLAGSLQRPLVDRYNTFIKVLAAMAKKRDLDEVSRRYLHRILKDLYEATKDIQIDNLRDAFSFDTCGSGMDNETKSFLLVHDCLITGQFKKAEELSEQLLIGNPISFDNYYLTAQVYAANGRSSSLPFKPSTIAHEILKNLTNLVGNRGNIELSLPLLLKIAMTLGENNIGLALWRHVQLESSDENVDSVGAYSAVLGKNRVAGAVHDLFSNAKSTTNELIRSELPESPTGLILNFKNGEDVDLRAFRPQIADTLINILQARRAVADSDFKEVPALLEDIIFPNSGASNLDAVYRVYAAELLFRARLVLNNHQTAANDVIELYNRNPNDLRHVPFQELLDIGRTSSCSELVGQISWPILVHLDNGSAQDLYEATDDFFESSGLKSPEGFLQSLGEKATVQQSILIRRVLVPAVIERSSSWTEDLEGQRQLRSALLQKLFETSLTDQVAVVEELSEIEQMRLLEADYRNVEGPKFILDFPDIDKGYLPMFEAAFDRFLMYRNYEKQGGIVEDQAELFKKLTVGPSSENRTKTRQENAITSERKTSEFLLQNAFTSLFNAYVWDSKSSVNSMLGTRIRHGSLENQLLSAFESANLLALANLDDDYCCNPEVEDAITGFKDEGREIIKEAFIGFTRHLHHLVNELVDKRVRIKAPQHIVMLLSQSGFPVEEMVHDEGLLNIERLFDTRYLNEKMGDTPPRNVNEFLEIGASIFEEEIATVLAKVGQYFCHTVAPYVVDEIDELERAVQTVDGDEEVKAVLINKLASAKDAFSRDIRIISDWFAVATEISELSGSFKVLAEMAFRVVDFAAGGRLGKIDWIEICELRVSGVSRVLIYEVLLILLRNVIRHSKVERHEKIQCSLTMDVDSELKFIIRNRVLDASYVKEAVIQANECISSSSTDDGVLGMGTGKKTGLRRIPHLLDPIEKLQTRVNALPCEVGGLPGFEIQISFKL